MSTYNIGDIVAVKSHAYFRELDDIKIAGEPTNILPLMVIVELLSSPYGLISEDTVEKTTSAEEKYKCVWFSLKSNTFCESWFDNASLKLIKGRDNGIVIERFSDIDVEFKEAVLSDYKYKDVLFTTSKLELKKVKETKVHDKKSSQISTLSSLLNFVCPPLQIIDVKSVIEKEGNKRGEKSKKPNKTTSTLLFKCRYYNASSDKWSEIFLPYECFEPILDVEKDLRNIERDRKENGYYMYDYTSDSSYSEDKYEETSILEIDDTTYLNGLYYLKTFDIIHQQWKILDIPLNGISDVRSKEHIYLKDSFPNFDFKKGSKAVEPDKLQGELTEFLEKYEAEKKYIQISFVNTSDKIEHRVLKDYFMVPGSTKRAPSYVHGFCCKKREMRSFNFSNIRSVKVLDLNYENNS